MKDLLSTSINTLV
jgi:hypothetical protein